jgi:murein DD-endopeptidase MepM/ murein hydrolase activator NlpD
LALFLVVGLIFAYFSFIFRNHNVNAYNLEELGVMGGPAKNIDDIDYGVLRPNFDNENKSEENLVINNMGSLESKTLSDSLDKNLNSFSQNKTKEEKSSLKIDFILPTNGINWGKLHSRNAVDIAASCGNDVVASASGLVVALSSNGWNQGYGKYVQIEHLGKIKTFYAHLSSINVSLGQKVKQGDKIGEVGDTGESTGCHLHFEVLGAKNPFVKN